MKNRTQGNRSERKTSRTVYIAVMALTVLLNGLSWCSTVFCDNYVRYVFPIWVNTYGRLTGLFPFSVGECLIFAGLAVLAAAVILGAVAVILRIGRRNVPMWVQRYLKFFAWVLAAVCLIMTLNCFMLYHVSSFAEMYLSGAEYYGETENYTLEEFLRMRNRIAARCNELSEEMQRDDNGYVFYPGSVSRSGEAIDMRDKAREEMQKLGETYPRLKGYYPRPKPLFFSDFMCQQYTLGWYFPFSMEANYNDVAYVMNLPSTMCHELAHLKGFIYEDEANFIGYLACTQSDDIYFEYSGYLGVLGYVERDLRKAQNEEPEAYAAAVEEQGLVQLQDIVYQDDIFVKPEDWERIEREAWFDTKTVSKAADTFVDTTLKVNGVPDGKVSYSRVVELMLRYEYGKSLVQGE